MRPVMRNFGVDFRIGKVEILATAMDAIQALTIGLPKGAYVQSTISQLLQD